MERLALLPPNGAAPASAYLSRLAPRSQVTMRRALEAVAVLAARVPMVNGKPLGRVALDRVPWAALDAARLAWLREQLGQRYAPASVRQAMTAVRGVLGPELDADRLVATRVAKPKRPMRVFEPTGHARADALRALRACGLTLPAVIGLDVQAWRVGGTRLQVRGRSVRVPDALGDALDRWVTLRGAAQGPLVCRTVKGGRVLPTERLSIGAARKAVCSRPGRDPLRDKSAEA